MSRNKSNRGRGREKRRPAADLRRPSQDTARRVPERYTAHMTKRLLQGLELEQRARELGVDIEGSPRTGSSSGTRPRAEDHELQQRVIEAERAKRESRLWLLALISAVASVVSALAAWAAILRK